MVEPTESESKAELQTGAGTTILSGAFYTGSNGWQGNQLTVAGAWKAPAADPVLRLLLLG